MPRGRTRSVTSHAIALVPGTRMPAPPELSPEQAVRWDEIIRALPMNWIRPENSALLVQLVRHIDFSDALSADVEQARAEVAASAADVKTARRARNHLLAVLRAHGRQSDSIARLSQKLRLSQLSRYTRDAEGAAIHARGNGTRPWENWDS